ncbi:hypothetical protein [Herbinix luporum]|jgi:hypothetical protein|uniref:Putative secreted protein n=1 Tax=Herbinix luporum TaxID=1679721 RepID=A0A0K8J640_9FIRM|nr:hypothetical protein [Herbinix luporum]CUH92930.1 putative secreted protein [Herbinix luporum]
MKKFLTKSISFVLCFAITFTTLTQTVSAATKQSNKEKQAIKAAQEVFNSLSPEAKEKFVTFIENEDYELLEIHKKYVDPDYDKMKVKEDIKNKIHNNQLLNTEDNNITVIKGVEITIDKPMIMMAAASPADALDILNTRLIALNLPTLVRYTFMAMGGGLAAAGLDGPLPIGDIIAAIVAVGGIAIIAYYWDDIAPKWDGIVSAFKEAFSVMASSIVSAFEEIYGQVFFAANKNKTVSEILKNKKGSIRNAPLPPGSPSWDSILTLTLAEIQRRAQSGDPGFKTIYKLLTDSRFNR